jgi:predicted AAA+ superfamily ATPase
MGSIRINAEFMISSFERKFISTVVGSRRVGKTHFITAYQKDHPSRRWVAFNMDVLADRERVVKEGIKILIEEKAEQLIGGPEKLWVIIDEAQKCPELFEQIKVLYDLHQERDVIKFILTGSALLSLHQLSSETLAGRIELLPMHAFSLAEATLLQKPNFPRSSVLDCLTQGPAFEDKLKEAIEEKRPFKPILNKNLENYLVWGGFPEVLSMENSNREALKEEKLIYLHNYLQTYLEKDVRAVEHITNLTLYRNLLDILAEQTGSLRDEGKMISALGCSRETLKKYRSLVEATYLYQEVYPHLGKTLKRLVKSPKGYLLNNGLISTLTGLSDLSTLEKTGLIGHRLENWFLNELNIWGARSASPQKIFFWQTTNQAEVDFVVIRKPYLYPFEVTYQSEINPSKIKHLMTFLKEEPNAPWAFYIYRGEFKIDHERHIIFIPCWAVS